MYTLDTCMYGVPRVNVSPSYSLISLMQIYIYFNIITCFTYFYKHKYSYPKKNFTSVQLSRNIVTLTQGTSYLGLMRPVWSHCTCTCIRMWVYVCVDVCVIKKEREKERVREQEDWTKGNENRVYVWRVTWVSDVKRSGRDSNKLEY